MADFRLTLRRVTAAAVVSMVAGTMWGQAAPLLLRNPSLSKDRVAFLYADDIWTVGRDGGEARRLTSGGTVAEGPFFSPDGTQIAYSTHDRGLEDVYVVGAEGGVPRRVTWHADGNIAVGWTPDGKDVLFGSQRTSYSDYFKLFTAHADGTGSPVALPLPSAEQGNLSPDGKWMAYEPILQWEDAWKHYRGGQTKKVWLVDLKTLDLVKVPRENSNDFSPVWEGKTVYFLSDRNGPVSLFSYDTESKAVAQVVENHGYDLKTVAAGPGALVYEQFGSLHLYDLATKQEHRADRDGEGRSAGTDAGAEEHRGKRGAERRDLTDRSESGGGGAWRDLYAAGGERRYAEPDQDTGSGGAGSGMVAGWKIDCVFQRCIG